MTLQVELTPIAEAQIDRTYRWYRERNQGLCRSMVSSIDEHNLHPPGKAPSMQISDRTRNFYGGSLTTSAWKI